MNYKAVQTINYTNNVKGKITVVYNDAPNVDDGDYTDILCALCNRVPEAFGGATTQNKVYDYLLARRSEYTNNTGAKFDVKATIFFDTTDMPVEFQRKHASIIPIIIKNATTTSTLDTEAHAIAIGNIIGAILKTDYDNTQSAYSTDYNGLVYLTDVTIVIHD